MPIELEKNYNPTETEPRIYQLWEQSGFFNPDNLPGKREQPFTIIMPPPNVTGILHMGHALGLTIQDILIRFKRMQGYKALWLPGTDHAAISTQARVEKDMYKTEKKSRHDLGREEFLKRVNAFAKESHDTMIQQLKVLGASCDWTREAYTLDEQRSRAVRTIFKNMYDDGLIYRGNRVVNWDPKGQTTISDDEIIYEERPATLYTFQYTKDFPIPIATTRPETKLGDTGVAVHPEGKYKQYIGKEYDVAFCGEKLHLKIIGDESVDQEFGTGAVGLTPAHSMTDWEIGQRHSLPLKQIINEYGKMMVGPETIKDKKTAEARETVVAWLKEQGLLEKEEAIKQNIATAERTGGIIEPLPKLQWFLSVDKKVPRLGKTFKEHLASVVRDGQIEIIPEHFQKTYFHWIDNLRDWCISRQIWFGHQIPVWYKNEEIYCGINPPTDNGWTQDPDTLDTWFSSGLWTFSTLGWPEKTADLETYHPTQVLVTAYEILFFWVARMILMTGYALKQIPFSTVFLTGIVRDGQGRKFSKSLGNGLDPRDVSEKFGMDAGRMALIIGNTPATDSRISDDKIKGYKHFANKLWNIARFILAQEKTGKIDPELKKEFDALTTDVTSDMESYRFYLAAEKIYHYVWHRLADELIEQSKEKKELTATLYYLLENSLKLLHPFMPFVTEEIWSKIPMPDKKLLMVQEWPA